MIRVALFGVVIVIVVGTAFVVTDWLLNPAATPAESLAERFPAGWESAPIVQYKEPSPPWPSGVPEVSAEELVAALDVIDRRKPQPRAAQPADAVFSDAQIASFKERLRVTAAQEPYWQAVEETLRLVVWDRGSGRSRVEPTSLMRFQEAAAPFVTTLNARQQSEIQALAHIVGMRLDLSSSSQ